MLYVTTRIQADAFTARHSLMEDRGPEGGFYLPMRLHRLEDEQIHALGDKSFGQNVADVMNLLFNTDLDGWSVEFSIGRYPIRLVRLGGKVTVAETWHNPQWQFDRLVRNLTKTVLETAEETEPSDWMQIASRMAVLFGTCGEMMQQGLVSGERPVDVVVPCGDFMAPVAAFYARELGLPIGNIVICCNENSEIWSLLHQGELRTDVVAVRTELPKCDQAVPAGLERLIYSALGQKEAKRFCEIARVGGNYQLTPMQQNMLRQGIHVSVISRQRTESMISGIYQSSGYIPDPYTALCYSGLMDYRSTTGDNRPALILAEESPAFHLDLVSSCLGMNRRELKERINKS